MAQNLFSTGKIPYGTVKNQVKISRRGKCEVRALLLSNMCQFTESNDKPFFPTFANITSIESFDSCCYGVISKKIGLIVK